MLIVFEIAVGILLLVGGRCAQLGLVAAIAFHIGLMAFGWFFYPPSILMIVAFGLLLRAERRHESASSIGERTRGNRRLAL